MIFTELRFLAFFVVVWLLHRWLPTERLRKVLLLGASYAFYAAWDWRFLGLIAGSTLLDYGCAIGISRSRGFSRRAWLGVSLAGNLGALGSFKYWDFFVRSAAEVFALQEASLPLLHVVLPVGISFYTFQTLSYSIDVYRGRIQASRSLLDVALFVAFFPQLVAGPIVRARDFLPQLSETRSRPKGDLLAASTLFFVGFAKKACIADNLGPIVEAYFATPADYSGYGAWLMVATYTVLVYCDFSGYTDMALGAAALLGYRLCVNFAFPLLAESISGFWRRWHVSMSSWFFDYLYLPLGGSRGTVLRTLRNLMVTMLVCGLWHGAAWNFVVFGAIHGLGLCAERLVRELGPDRGESSRQGHWWVGNLWSVAFFGLSLLCFYPGSRAQLGERYLSLAGGGAVSGPPLLGPFLVVLAIIHWCFFRYRPLERLAAGSRPARVCVLGIFAGLCFVFMSRNPEPFVYFQF